MPRKRITPILETAPINQEQTGTQQAPESRPIQTAPDLVQLPASTVKVTRKNLIKIQEQKYMEHIDPMLDEFYNALRVQLRKGNPKAIEITAKIAGLDKSSGVSIVNNVIQANANRAQANGEGESRASFASIVRRLDAREGAATKAQDFIDVKAS